MTTFHRTNLNLHATDVEFLQRRHGTGWTTIARDIIHAHVLTTRRDCPDCEGSGQGRLNTPTLDPPYLPCPTCGGTGVRP